MNQAWEGFHEDTRSLIDKALIAAVFLHAVTLFLAPAAPEPVPVDISKVDTILYEFASEPGEPPPEPASVKRPAAPALFSLDDFAVSEEAGVEETIRDTKVAIDAPIRDSSPGEGRIDRPVEWGGPGNYETWSTPPSPRRLVQPDYPPLAREAGIEGTVIAEAWLDAEGRVVEVRIVESSSSVFHETVIRALYKSLFHPAKQKERAVESSIRIPFEFRLE
ncbi:MAG: energy transducer TonB [Candidatus Eisenbacteria bacterium]|nr:energy transducer TonB [Candidatus Eisenbacteria bacterium]